MVQPLADPEGDVLMLRRLVVPLVRLVSLENRVAPVRAARLERAVLLVRAHRKERAVVLVRVVSQENPVAHVKAVRMESPVTLVRAARGRIGAPYPIRKHGIGIGHGSGVISS